MYACSKGPEQECVIIICNIIITAYNIFPDPLEQVWKLTVSVMQTLVVVGHQLPQVLVLNAVMKDTCPLVHKEPMSANCVLVRFTIHDYNFYAGDL